MKNKPQNDKNVRKADYTVVKKIFSSAKCIKKGLMIASIFSAISVVISLIAPKYLGKIVDEINRYSLVTQNGEIAFIDLSYIKILSWILIALFVVSCGASIIKMYKMNNTVSHHFTATTRINLSDKLQHLPVSYVDTTTNGDFIARMTNDVSAMGNTVHNVLDLAIQGVIQLVFIAVMMFTINWSMALIVLVVVPISILLSTYIAKKSETYWHSMHKNNGVLNGLVEESYANILLIKAFNCESEKAKQHKVISDELELSLKKAGFYSQIVAPIINFTNKVAYVLICILGGYLAIKNVITVGDVTAIILYSQMLSMPLSGIANGLSMLQHTTVAAKRVYEILDKEEICDNDIGQSFLGKGSVDFENVEFSYKPDEPLIKNLSASVKPGQKVAIVGPTGAGKTTIVNLLMRFYDINQGKIMVDGLNIYDVPREEIRAMFAMVLQDTWLFNGTVYDNVAYGKKDATKEEVIKACEMSYCDHFIRTLPQGYDTIINDDTTNLSGGQKQLLTIARAFLSNKKMLILDEATSSVDTRTEVLIQKAMEKLMKGRTCFVIAHRLSTIVDADLILVIENGDIVEKGTHSELLKQNGLYARIYNSQYDLIGKKIVH